MMGNLRLMVVYIALYCCHGLAREEFGLIQMSQRFDLPVSVAGVGFNNKVKKTLADPEYVDFQDMWHPTLNLGKLPADFTHSCHQQIWLRCSGCIHGCGRHHEWEATLTT